MGRLQVVVVECNYKEIVRMTSEDVLIWAKRVEAQRMQAAILSDITDSQRFD